MRVAPLGAFFADNLNKVVEQAELPQLLLMLTKKRLPVPSPLVIGAAVAYQLRAAPKIP